MTTEAIDMLTAASEIKEIKRISKYIEDIRGQPVIINLSMEVCSQGVLKLVKKLNKREEFWEIFIRGDRPREVYTGRHQNRMDSRTVPPLL